MTKLNKMLWGREFSLSQSYLCDSDEDVLDSQQEAVQALIAAWNEVEQSKAAVEKYCLEHDGDATGEKVENIFKYVMPTELLALRDQSEHKVALLCNYRFDPEHGIAVVFKNEKFLKVTPQDEV